ncbi:hypothetical protein PUNSTDRAFT_113902 [Punctularia strigosozonata HHB-11173 SS5]|uniref:uncharacterized protein n=1 Tax=Punctularia strigosozonata (strain HHB-11173) TaxID=741275 RepID=UPI0004416381|nr:uncharacterized protein PUNSTDRAFT_113902 [Punctularia strigosozonata HHB-11173 SS5]EIN08352.1 hypothetical protein PUNSTDRAFT_113902 [Punctularia strigosozonata HHB-11173 SS5]
MTLWNSPAVLAYDQNVFAKLMHAMLGLYGWEFLMSLDFEWSFLCGKRRLRWPMVPYFLGRYMLLTTLITICIALDSTHPLDCQTLYTFNQLAGMSSAGFSTINLSIRTIAIWDRHRYITFLVIFLSLGQWAVILQGALLRATYIPDQGCIITEAKTGLIAISFIYTMAFDFLIMCLNTWRLLPYPQGGWTVTKLLFRDGMIYFAISFLGNLAASVVMLLNLNSVMDVILNVPAVVVANIASSRAVRRLALFRQKPDSDLVAPSDVVMRFSPRFPDSRRLSHMTSVEKTLPSFFVPRSTINEPESPDAETRESISLPSFPDPAEIV